MTTLPPVLYHGGSPFLWAGERLVLPPSITGAKRGPRWTGRDPNYRRDRIYLTTDREKARQFAALSYYGERPGGAVYRVQVDPTDLEPDPGSTVPGLSWQARRAFVVAVVATNVLAGPYLHALEAEAALRAEQERPHRRTRPFTPPRRNN